MTPGRPEWRRLVGACAGVVGPVSFVSGWVVVAAMRPGYSAVREAISQLARVGAPHRGLMTAAFVSFGATVPVFAPVLADSLDAGKALKASVSIAGLATLGVAAVPLSSSGEGTADLLHGMLAVLGYCGMALSPLCGAVALYRRGDTTAAAASVVTGVVSAASLAASTFASDVGLFQRLGLGVVDAWLSVMAISILDGGVS
jgi:hypothetical membrane protein